MSLSPQVLPVVGPVVTVPLGRPELLVVVVVEPAFWLAWLTDLLVAPGARAQ